MLWACRLYSRFDSRHGSRLLYYRLGSTLRYQNHILCIQLVMHLGHSMLLQLYVAFRGPFVRY